MITDDIDEIFKKMMGKFNAMFGRDIFDDFQKMNPVFGNEMEEGMDFGKNDTFPVIPDIKTKSFGYEIITGNDMKEPIIRIHGNPDDFPALREKLEGLINGSLDKIMNSTPTLQPISNATSKQELGREEKKVGDFIEPFYEKYDGGEGVVMINVDLPGIDKERISINPVDDKLRIEGLGEIRQFRADVPFERSLEGASINWELNNGLVEIRIQFP